MQLQKILEHMMRPAGGGIPSFSAGKGSALELQQKLYVLTAPTKVPLTEAVIVDLWKKSWPLLKTAKVAVIGVPSDTGAGIRRGAAYGPRAVRQVLLEDKTYQGWLESGTVVDLGDVYVNPHLLHDELLNENTKKQCQDEMYPHASPKDRGHFAVSALSQTQQILNALWKEHPHVKVFVIGGDHSVAWPVTAALASRYPGTLGIVQPDAHTDMLASRLGIKYCFGTWSYHANELLGRNGKLVQLGIRQSARDKQHWESTTGVKQYWAAEINSRKVDEVVGEIVQHLKSRGVKQVYFSNDIDGTDESEAMATGTPVSGGLHSPFLLAVIEKLGTEFEMVAADMVEVAPDLAPSSDDRHRTCWTAAKYSLACIQKQINKS